MELIDREDALKQIERREKICQPDADGNVLISTRAFKTFLNNRKLVDAKPIIHAHWVDTECSYCNHSFTDLVDAVWIYENPKYCPYCGCQMDEKVER